MNWMSCKTENIENDINFKVSPCDHISGAG
jgi:hypothetical protein